MNLDDTDFALIDALKADGRAGLVELGRQVGLSRDAVRERLRRLRSAGVVSVAAAPEPAALGYTTIAAVRVRVQGPVHPVARRIAEAPEADFVVCTLGEYDILVEVFARDEEHLLEILETRIRAIPGVRSTSVSVYVEIVKWTPGGFGKAVAARPVEGVAHIGLRDKAIVMALQADGRASYQDLADATGLSYAHARRRAKTLIDSGTVRIITTVSRLATGSAVAAEVGVTTTGAVEDAAARLRAFDEVEVAGQTLGRFDLVADVVCRDRARLRRLVFKELRAIPGVTGTETLLYVRTVKLPAQWGAEAMESYGKDQISRMDE